MTKDQYAKAVVIIARLATLFPQTFFVYERRRRPLKINIHLDLAGVMEPDEYTRNIGYLCNLREGAERVDLSGNPVDVVTAEHAAGATGWAKARMQRKLETECKAAKEAAHKIYVEAWETVAKLQALYPLAFFVAGRKRRPLKADILNDLVDMPEAANALHFYTQSHWYLRSMKEGAERVDLAGNPVGAITAEQAADAAAAAKAYQEKMERQRAKAIQPTPQTAAAPQLPIPEMVVAQPKRLLGLADLKAAALARRQKETVQ